MKLILEIYQTDGYTYGYENYYAFECESKEKAEIELFELCEGEKSDEERIFKYFKFHGHELYSGDFYERQERVAKKSGRITGTFIYREPKFYTPDELWEKLKA